MMSVSRYGRILQNLTCAYDEIESANEPDFSSEAELASYFIRMSIDATQSVVSAKLGYREPERLRCEVEEPASPARESVDA
jgi:hypothetical protein